MKKLISATLAFSILFNLTACGTILYPERKGQRGGRIDPSIAILDGVGLLMFIIPGAIAFAVDFSNGTIYMPSGKRSLLDNDFNKNDMIALNVGKDKLTKANIDRIIAEETGKDVSVLDAQVFKVGANGNEVRVN